MSARTGSDIFYIVNKHAGKETARNFIADILNTFTLADISEEGFREALGMDMDDFEDAVQYVICARNSCDVLVTRNKVDYGSRSNVLEPEKFKGKL